MSVTADLQWTTARDGSRTAKLAGRWLGGCSVPKRSAEMMLRKFVARGNVVCLLMPTHAQQVPACLAKLDASAALIVIARESTDPQLFRECADLAPFESAGRLFLAWDEESLRAIFVANPGLPIPQQFVRLPITPVDQSDAAIKWAQKIFSEVASSQTARTVAARTRWNRESDALCVAVRQAFSLWNDAGATLANIAGGASVDISDPRQSASALLAERAADCGAVVTADWARADQKDLIAADQPWIAWITQTRVPAFVPTSPHDALLLADESLRATALANGWPTDRLAIARWPGVAVERLPGDSLAIIADLPSLEPPELVREYSSWRVVWDAIRQDLTDYPHKLAGDVDGYLEKARRHFGVPPENFPAALFVERLIAPAYAIGIARWLIKEQVPLAIYGSGWESVEGVEIAVRTDVGARSALSHALSTSAGIVDMFLASIHPSRSVGIPQLTTVGRTPQRIIQDAQAILAGRMHFKPVESPLSLDLIRRFAA